MKKLILVSVLLFNCNAMAEEYNVVCHMGYSGVVIRGVEDIELAKEIVNELDKTRCKIIKVKN
jgi:hypothetical protein